MSKKLKLKLKPWNWYLWYEKGVEEWREARFGARIVSAMGKWEAWVDDNRLVPAEGGCSYLHASRELAEKACVDWWHAKLQDLLV